MKTSRRFRPSIINPQPYTGPSADEVLALRKQFLNPGIFLYYKKPIMIVEGKMQYVWDDTGKRYLDGLGGIVTVSVGHCHPHVVAAAQQAERDAPAFDDDLSAPEHRASTREKLASKMPGDLKVCYFVNSGSEANDLALLMARAYTGNYDMIALRNAYHGGNASGMGLTAHSTWKFNVPHSFGVHHAIAPVSVSRALRLRRLRTPGKKYAADVKNLIDYATPGKVAGVHRRIDPGRRRLRRFSATAISSTPTNTCAPPAASASPTKCRPASAAPARISGASRRRA